MRRLAAVLTAAALAAATFAAAAGGVQPLRIDAGPQGLSNDATPTFEFTAPAPATCALDRAAPAPCESAFTAAPLADGPHVFEVFAAGESAYRTFTVDTAAPALTFDGPAQTDQSAPAYTFGAPEDGVTLECWVDDAEPAACTSPWTVLDLRNGTHAVYVRATDAAGNATERGTVVAVDAPPPDTTIEAGPEGTVRERAPRFGLRSSKPRSTFECRLDAGEWGGCELAELAPGAHVFEARARDAAGNVDRSPATREFIVADCETTVTIGVVEAVAECFQRDGAWLVADGPVKVNGITFNPIGRRTLRLDPTARKLSLGRIELKFGPVVLYQGELEWTVPDGTSVTLARFDLETFSRLDAPPDDEEAALDLPGDDDANVMGFPLKGEAELKLEAGASVLTGTIELPKAFTDAEGNGLTGTVTLRADNERGLRVDGVSVTAPLAMIGQLELHDLFLRFAGDGNGDAAPSCNAASPGLRWEGGASAIVLPTPNRLRLEDVGVGFADGGFNYAQASWNPGQPGHDFGGGVRVQRIAFSLCAGPPLRLEGRIALTALPVPGSEPALRVPDAGLIFTAGDPWTLRAEAPEATLDRGRELTFKDLFVEYRSSGTVRFGGQVEFTLAFKGATGAGDLDAAVRVTAGAQGFIDGSRFNADLSARGCFNGTFRIGGTLPVGVHDVCPQFSGVVSSTGVAVCGALEVGGHDLGSIGAGYRWGGNVEFMASACDVGPWRELETASASAAGARTLTLPAGRRGVLVALRGAGGPPRAVLRGPGGEVVRATGVVKTARALAFTNLATRTTYVVLARPAGGRWTVESEDVLTDVRAAGLLARPAVSARVDGRGRARVLRYRVAPRRGQRVVFYEGGRRLGSAQGARGTLRFRAGDGPAGLRRIEALVVQDGLPRRRTTVARYRAPGPQRPGRPGALRVRRDAAGLRVRWARAAGARRYGIRVATSDGRRRFFLSDARELRVGGVPRARRVSVRVVGLRADNVAGRAVTRRAK